MTASISSEQRHSPQRPCRICGGHNQLPAGQGKRCYGYLSSDGRYEHCTREELAGGLDRVPGGDTFAHRLDGPCKCGTTHGEWREPALPSGQRTTVQTPPRIFCDFREAGAARAYDYTDEQGTVLFQAWRFAKPDGRKTFKQAQPVRGGWVQHLEGVRRVPYRLVALLAADPSVPVIYTEGEKDADRLAELGYVATTNPMGGGKWRPEYAEHFRGRHVVLPLDNDPDGEKHGRIIGQALSEVAASVRVLRLPNLPPKGDVSDWLDAGGSEEDLKRLIAQAPAWRHEQDPHTGAESNERPVSDPRLMVRSLMDVQSQPVDWLWQRWLGQGKFHLLGGYAGDGKSTLLASLAAEGSRAGRWPDDTPIARPFRTLFMLGEDAAGDTLKPRLELHSADMAHVFVNDGVIDEKGDERHFNITKHLSLLEATIIQNQIDWVVIDPLTTIMAGTDRNAEGDTRDTLTPLVKMAERLNVAITGVAHVGKSDGVRRAAQKILGATAFHAMARIVWMIAPDGEDRMALGVSKSNLAIKPLSLAWSREEDGPIYWQGLASQDVEELLTNAPTASPKADAEGFLREYLATGGKPSNEVFAAAKAQGISDRTLRRAADTLRVKKWKAPGSNGQWFWMLPDGQPNASTVDRNAQQSNLATPIDIQVAKLDKFPADNMATRCTGGHLHATTPIFSTGHGDGDSHIMEGGQVGQPSLLRGGQVPSGANGQPPRNGWDRATRVVIG